MGEHPVDEIFQERPQHKPGEYLDQMPHVPACRRCGPKASSNFITVTGCDSIGDTILREYSSLVDVIPRKLLLRELNHNNVVLHEQDNPTYLPWTGYSHTTLRSPWLPAFRDKLGYFVGCSHIRRRLHRTHVVRSPLNTSVYSTDAAPVHLFPPRSADNGPRATPSNSPSR